MSNVQMKQVAQKPKFSVAITTQGYQNLIKNTLGDPNRAKRFVAAITSAVATNKDLQDCDAGTILAGGLLGESLNLSPSPQLGQYYLVPFKDKKTDSKKATFVLGYKGYLQLALRTGNYADIDALEIREGEYLGKDSMTGKPKFRFIEDDDVRENLPIVGYMAYLEYNNGFRKAIYWTKEKMLNHADKFSPAFSKAAYEKIQKGEVADSDMWKYSSFWYKDFDSMAKKTLIRQLISKWGMMSTDMQSAYVHDNAVLRYDDSNELIVEHEDEIVEEETISAPVVVEEPEVVDMASL